MEPEHTAQPGLKQAYEVVAASDMCNLMQQDRLKLLFRERLNHSFWQDKHWFPDPADSRLGEVGRENNGHGPLLLKQTFYSLECFENPA
jgi:hypothetical protein